MSTKTMLNIVSEEEKEDVMELAKNLAKLQTAGVPLNIVMNSFKAGFAAGLEVTKNKIKPA